MQGWASRCTTQRVAAERTDDDTPPGAPRGQTTRRDAKATVSQPRASSSDYLYDPAPPLRSNRTASVDGTKPVKSSRQLCFSHIACFTELVSSLIAISFLPSTSLQKLCVCVNCLIFGRRKICEPYTRRRGDAKRIKQRFFGMRAMPSKPDRTPTSVQAAAAVSLVALVACALASDAHASRLPVEPGVADGELSARVGTIIERVRAGEPTLLPQLPPEPKMAWRN